VFLICETWQNQEVLDKHSQTPEFIETIGTLQRCGTLKLETFSF
jgi:quinol monooxygenase YgiN